MQLSTYLNYNGQCEEAFRLYQTVLDGHLDGFFRYAGSPMADMVPKDWQDKVMHVTLRVGDVELMGCDTPPEQFKRPQGFSVTLALNDTGEAERIFAALGQGGRITLALQKTFWAERFGMLVDRFGIPWMINCGRPRA